MDLQLASLRSTGALLATTVALLICFAANVRAEEAADGDAAVEGTAEKAGELNPKTGDHYLELAWNQLLNRKPREAIAASLKALKTIARLTQR